MKQHSQSLKHICCFDLKNVPRLGFELAISDVGDSHFLIGMCSPV